MKKIITLFWVFALVNCASTSYGDLDRNVTKPVFSGNSNSIIGNLDIKLEVSDKIVEGTGKRNSFAIPVIVITFPFFIGPILIVSNLVADNVLEKEAYNDALTKANADGLFQTISKREFNSGLFLDEEKLTVIGRPIYYKPAHVAVPPVVTIPDKKEASK